MKRFFYLKLIMLGIGASVSGEVPKQETFSQWQESFIRKAAEAGISSTTLTLLKKYSFDPQVIALDRAQPEFQQTTQAYVEARIKPLKANGRKNLYKHRALLKKISEKYHVNPAYIVALWGIETNFGRITGDFPLFQYLMTLAFDARRPDLFSHELMVLLRLVDRKQIPISALKGSWAGALGQCQFMPSSVEKMAIDYDRDGVKDLWGSYPDIFASIAYYLHQAGWQPNQGWGMKVILPAAFNDKLKGLDIEKPVREWAKLGVRRANSQPLSLLPYKASIIQPDGPTGAAYLVRSNFRVLLKWNRSYKFALAVGMLADSLQSR